MKLDNLNIVNLSEVEQKEITGGFLPILAIFIAPATVAAAVATVAGVVGLGAYNGYYDTKK